MIIFSILACTVMADDFSDILQDLAVQTACLGRYSAAQTGVYVTSRYNDPPDWYDPPMMANRFAAMSGSMTRTITFYGICFDYAQFAWDDIKKYQKMYNDAGMKDQQWYIASTKTNDPYTIILYDPVSREKATVISNGVYLKEKSRHSIYAHDGATGHAWIWIQHKNGTWYWIDPTWTDNTGYVWWGIVKDGSEIQYYPDYQYCVASNYPKPGVTNTETRSSNSTYTEKTESNTSSVNSGIPKHFGNFFIGYNYSSEKPFGFTIGGHSFYSSWNLNMSAYFDGVTSGTNTFDGLTGEKTDNGLEFTVGYLFKLKEGVFRLPIGIGISMTDEYQYYHDSIGNTGWYGNGNLENRKFIFEAGLQLILFRFLYLSSTYRLIGLSKSGFTIGSGFIF